jgi:general secretion pathway protein D
MSKPHDCVRRCLGLGMLAAVAALPLRAVAQQSSEPESGESSLTETQSQHVFVPPAAAPPNAVQSTHGSQPAAAAPQPGSAQQAVPPTPPPPASQPVPQPVPQKDQRKAEKLYLQGARLLDQNDTQGAYRDFTAAFALDPSNRQYLAAKEIARQHLVTSLVQEADKAHLMGHADVSRQKLEEALELDPKNPIVAQHVEELVEHNIAINRSEDAETAEQGVDAAGPIVLTPANIKQSFHLKGTPQEILRQVLSAYQITPVVDSSVADKQVRLDTDEVDYAHAAQMLKLITGTFFVPLDPKRVLVAKDDRENRTKYERLLIESIYLPGLSATELTDVSNLAKNVFETPVAVLQPQKNVLTVRAPATRMKALNATLEELLDGRAQVVFDVRLIDIDRVRTTNIGVTLPSQVTVFNVQSELNSLLQNNQAAIQQIISSGLAAPGDYGAILAILIATGQITSSILTQGFLTFGGGLTQFGYTLGSVTGNFALNTSDSRTLDEIHLRVQDQETATFKVGTHYPIVTSTVSSGGSSLSVPGISSAGLSSALNGLGVNPSSLTSQVTIPQIQYQDLGLTMKATPRVQHGQEVAVNMELEFTALAGSTVDGNPVLNNRKYTATITLPDGNSALVVSTLSKQETRAVTGIPGINELPGLQSGTDDSKNIDVSTLLVLVTPHIVRRTHMDVAGRAILLPRHD